MADEQHPGRGWHGDAAGHAAAGRLGGQKSGGNFANDRDKARRAGSNSGGNFANDREKARRAGRLGGQRSKRPPATQTKTSQ